MRIIALLHVYEFGSVQTSLRTKTSYYFLMRFELVQLLRLFGCLPWLAVVSAIHIPIYRNVGYTIRTLYFFGMINKLITSNANNLNSMSIKDRRLT